MRSNVNQNTKTHCIVPCVRKPRILSLSYANTPERHGAGRVFRAFLITDSNYELPNQDSECRVLNCSTGVDKRYSMRIPPRRCFFSARPKATRRSNPRVQQLQERPNTEPITDRAICFCTSLQTTIAVAALATTKARLVGAEHRIDDGVVAHLGFPLEVGEGGLGWRGIQRAGP